MYNFLKNIVKILSILLFSITIMNCMYKEYYLVEPVDFDLYYYYLGGPDYIFDRIGYNAFIYFPVSRGELYMEMSIKNAHQFKEIYIKEINVKIDDTIIIFLKDKCYEIDYTHISLGKIEKTDMKKLLKIIGTKKIELPITQEYFLDNGELIHEEYVYFFEYESRMVSFFEK